MFVWKVSLQNMNFKQKLEKIVKKNNSLLCIGLDTDLNKIPKHILKEKNPQFRFNKAIIDATSDLVCSYKPNIAFYEAYGIDGLTQLKKTIEYIKSNYNNIPIILDAKRGDISNTAKMYAKSLFDYWEADAVTVNPYLGFDAIEPFLKYKDKGIIILCITSNPGASDFQDSKVPIEFHPRGGLAKTPRDTYEPLYIKVAKKILGWNQKYRNCLMVVGATYPRQLKEIRKIAPNMFFLLPGIGTQEGDLKNTFKYGLTKEKSGLIINVSRAIIFAGNDKDFAEKARQETQKYNELINTNRFL